MQSSPERVGATAGARAWVLVAAVLAAGALAGWPVQRTLIDWQPALAISQPWRAVSAVFVHYSAMHLGANLAGTALVAALGAAMPVPRRASLAWLAAWPLTQFGLLLQPALMHYGGLSGVLHAGAAVVAVELMLQGSRGLRLLGLLLALGLCVKIGFEAPWRGPLRYPPGWDIAVAPLAHATGAASGAMCALAARALSRCGPRMRR